MAGVRDMVALIPPILVSNLAITSPSRTLSTCRIAGSTDATYGTVGWAPPIDGSPFAVLFTQSVKAKEVETWRLWTDYEVQIFIGISQADEPGALFNYNDQALQWMDNFIQVIAQHRHLLPGSTTISSILGDVQWSYLGGTVRVRHEIYNRNYYGLDLRTNLHIVQTVNWQ